MVTRIHRVSLVVCELIGHLSNHTTPLDWAEFASANPTRSGKTPWELARNCDPWTSAKPSHCQWAEQTGSTGAEPCKIYPVRPAM